ncbi:MAG: polyhydroxyalkanoate synthesis repressor PhaR [Proteobacteria bacterium]|nr:MAG: polyhydroxyalkanoate synthesis repressor PhaR [Pseudomonadota bacterium]
MFLEDCCDPRPPLSLKRYRNKRCKPLSTRIIKKYPNRRLYDTEQSKYITLADLKTLIADGIDIEVQDANSGSDITRAILLQIINDQESADKPLFTTEILTRMIRFYGGQSQGLFTDYLERTLEMFLEQQHQYQNRFAELIGQTPMETLTDMATRNMEIWSDMQKRMLEGTNLFSADKKPDRKKPS